MIASTERKSDGEDAAAAFRSAVVTISARGDVSGDSMSNGPKIPYAEISMQTGSDWAFFEWIDFVTVTLKKFSELPSTKIFV